jgi:hypothetical protein
MAERPWSSPVRVAIAAAVALALTFVAVEAALGRLRLLATDVHVAADFQIALALVALVAYLLGAFAGAVRGAERTLSELAPAFVRSSQAEAARASVVGRVSSPRLRRVGLVGAGIGLLIPLATNLTLETWFVWELSPEAIAHRLLLAPLGWGMARFLAVVWVESQRLSALGASALRVDLVDLRPLAPLATAGLRHALLSAGVLSVVLVGFRDANVAPGLPFVIAVGCIANVALSAAVLWLALRGAHVAIAREKAAADAAANVVIRALRLPGAKHAPGALADALAWKRFVAGAPDWPLDFPTLRRFVLPLALPLASLVGGAFMEALVTRFLAG